MESVEKPFLPKKTDTKIKNANLKTGQEIFEKYLFRDNKLQEEDFIDIYGEKEVQDDLKRLDAMKKSKDYEKPTSHSIVLENLFTEIAELNNWFGEGEIRIVQLCECDDKLVNGVHADVVLEGVFGEGNDEHILRLGIDLTTATNEDKLYSKLKKCIDPVKDGKLLSAKYFQSELNEDRGKLAEIPVVFAGIDKNTLHELCESVGRKDDIAKHPVQLMILDQIVHELSVLLATSDNVHGAQSQLSQALEYYQEVFANILQQKESLRSKDFREKALDDGVHKYIMKYV